MMKRVVFFVQPDWAFGVIHQELCKYLFLHGIDCRILPWDKSYTLDEMMKLNDTTDIFLTTPHGWIILNYSYKTISADKCIIVTHAKSDLLELKNHSGNTDFMRVKTHACVSQWLISVSKELDITRECYFSPLGINYNAFYTSPPGQLKIVGYAGAMGDRVAHIKRHKLIVKAVEAVGLRFVAAPATHRSFVTMPGFYKNVDAVICSSTEEGAGLPMLEAGAAGRLVITTPVGHYEEKVGPAGADVVPIDENEFLDKTVELLSYYKCNPQKYRERCLEIQHHAITYDWKYVIDKWVELLK